MVHRCFATGVSMLAIMVGAVPALAQTTIKSDDPSDIVVTATRRDESVLAVPYNVSAVSGDTLESARITDFNSLRTLVPGLTAPDYGARANGRSNSFTIRGVNTDSLGGGTLTNPKLQISAVSTYVDETPIFTNLRLNDIQRVEVLRGPQGTLYGAGSVGGTIRLIQNKPSTAGFEYKVSGKLAGVHASGDTTWGIDGLVNVPITGRLAVRVSGGYDRTAGFIDATAAVNYTSANQPVLAVPSDPLNSGYTTRRVADFDDAKSWFARGSLLWNVTDRLDAQISYHHQHDESGGFSRRGINDTRYTSSRPIPLEPSDRDTDFGSLTLTADFGFATMTSATSYSEIVQEDTSDFTGPLTPFLFLYGGFPRLTSPIFSSTKDRTFAQEVRAVSSGDGPFGWTVGAYYQKTKQRFAQRETVPGFAAWSELAGSDFYLGFPNFGDVVQFYNGGTRPSLLPTDQVYRFDRTIEFDDIAAFAELSYRIVPKWQVTVGGRVFWQKFAQNSLVEFPICGTFCANNALGQTVSGGVRKDNSQIFKFNSSYDLTDNLLGYVTVSQGYRGGGANSYPVGNCALCDPPDFLNYNPDTAINYEVGLKGKLTPKLRFSAAVYQIDWKDIQVEAGSTSGNPVIINGNRARSRGVELETSWRPTPELTLTGGYAYVDAIITRDFSIGTGATNIAARAGDRLPGASEHQANFALDYQRRITPDADLLFRIDAFYRSSVVNQINTTAFNFATVKGFGIVNGSVGVRLNDRLSVIAFLDNITNEDGVTAINRGTRNAPAYQPGEFLSRPRTLGVRLTYSSR